MYTHMYMCMYKCMRMCMRMHIHVHVAQVIWEQMREVWEKQSDELHQRVELLDDEPR